MRRTYALVFASVLVTIVGAAFAFTQPALLDAVVQHPFITFIAMFAPLWMVMRAPREYPKNLVLTFLFTFIEGIWLAPFLLVAEQHSPGVVGQAALLTFTAFGGLSMYAIFSRRDFSAWGSFFMVGLVVLFVAMILNMFMHSAAAGVWISGVGVLVFSGLLVFDTWRILRSGTFGPEDYVVTAVQIYLDLLNLFVFILSLLGGRGRR
ncbi:MAG TPA: Bax inhibitor-1/YccA family protein [Gemmatimonadaceae bacterium]